MGRLVSKLAKDDGHEVSLVLTSRDATRSAENWKICCVGMMRPLISPRPTL